MLFEFLNWHGDFLETKWLMGVNGEWIDRLGKIKAFTLAAARTKLVHIQVHTNKKRAFTRINSRVGIVPRNSISSNGNKRFFLYDTFAFVPLKKGGRRLTFICVRIRVIRKCLVQKRGTTILITVAAIIIKCNLMLGNSLYAHWGGTDTLLSNYDENVPKFFYIYNKIRKAQRTYPTFSSFSFP